jgi:hypothetical protein
METTNRFIAASAHCAIITDPAAVVLNFGLRAKPVDLFKQPDFDEFEAEPTVERNRRWVRVHEADGRRFKLAQERHHVLNQRADEKEKAKRAAAFVSSLNSNNKRGANLIAVRFPPKDNSNPNFRAAISNPGPWHAFRTLVLYRKELENLGWVSPYGLGCVKIKPAAFKLPPPLQNTAYLAAEDINSGTTKTGWIREPVDDPSKPATLEVMVEIIADVSKHDLRGKAHLRNIIAIYIRGVLMDVLSPVAVTKDEYIQGLGLFEWKLHGWYVEGVAEALSFLEATGSVKGALFLITVWFLIPLGWSCAFACEDRIRRAESSCKALVLESAQGSALESMRLRAVETGAAAAVRGQATAGAEAGPARVDGGGEVAAAPKATTAAGRGDLSEGDLALLKVAASFLGEDFEAQEEDDEKKNEEEGEGSEEDEEDEEEDEDEGGCVWARTTTRKFRHTGPWLRSTTKE